MEGTFTVVTDSVRAMFIRVGEFLPALLGAVLILIVGWIAGKIFQRLIVQFLKLIRLDDLSEKLQIAEFLRRGEIPFTLSELIGIFLYWLVILAFVLAALNALGLTMAAGLLERIINFVPNVLAGVIMLILGLFLGAVVSGVVQTAAANLGIGQAKALSQIARVVVIIFAVAVALEKFFNSIIIQTTFTLVVGAVAFGTALAFGLGCKDLAGRAVSEFVEKLRGGR